MNFYHRPHRSLLAPPVDGSRGRAAGFGRPGNFDTNMVIILAALLFALICALGINSIVRYVLRCLRRVDSGDGDGGSPPPVRSGIGKGLLRRIPVAVYGSAAAAAGADDCPICLAEFSDGEKIRILPKCRHCFHVRCVDVWLASNSSCPTCRRVLAAEEAGPAGEEAAARQPGDGGGLSDEVG